jgi:hypothetical protein
MKSKLFFTVTIAFICTSLFSQTTLHNILQDPNWYNLGQKRDVLSSGELNINNTVWDYPVFGKLIFIDGYYVYGTPWSGIESYGKYSIKDTKIIFSPNLKIPRWDDIYFVKELIYTTSNRKDKSGNQLLIDEDDTVSFYGWKYPTESSFTIINKIPCKSVNIPIRILKNNVLYTLPKSTSKNIFDEKNYYGNKATIGKAAIIYEPLDPDFEWVFISIDFTYDEPTDGGGPYYNGWIEKNYISEVINHNMIIISDNLRVRSEPNLEENSKILTILRKWTVVKIIKVGDYIQKINGIEDRWYFVSLDNGMNGWIFGGYAKQFNDEKELQCIKDLYQKY